MDPIWLKNYPAGIDPAPCIPDGSLADLIRDRQIRFADREAYWSMGRSINFRDVVGLADSVAQWLRNQGLVPGDRIAIMLPNVLAFPVVTFGALLGGFVIINLNPQYTSRELSFQLRDSGARILFAWEPVMPVVQISLNQVSLDRVISVSPRSLIEPTGMEFDEIIASHVSIVSPLKINASAIAFLQYTGGTTGVSKGAMLTHRNVLAQLTQVEAWSGNLFPFERGPHRTIQPTPLYHVAALMVGLFPTFARGASLILIADPRNLDALVETMRTQSFSAMAGINSLYIMLAAHARISSVDFTRCVASFSGGAATQVAVAKRWHGLTGTHINEGYGLTEACGLVSRQACDGRPFDGTVGFPIPLTEISIRDEHLRELGPEEIGEVCVRGPQLMAGYWNRPDETSQVMTDDGYLRTGDVGFIDAKGSLTISDRKKDMILVSGFNVFPNEIEGILLRHPKVLEVAVVGVADTQCGERPMAFVVKRDPSLTAEELCVLCIDELTAYKRPLAFEFRNSLPKSPVGKILRRALRDEAQHLRAGRIDPRRSGQCHGDAELIAQNLQRAGDAGLPARSERK